MKQILRNLRNGATLVADVPMTGAKIWKVLVATSQTLVSAGTERMLMEFGKGGLNDKARQQPDKGAHGVGQDQD